jgi:hypothetical protein
MPHLQCTRFLFEGKELLIITDSPPHAGQGKITSGIAGAPYPSYSMVVFSPHTLQR